VKDKPAPSIVRILVKVVDAICIEQGRPTLNAMHFVALAEQKLSKIRAILPGYACY
jgi:hypothetical protein